MNNLTLFSAHIHSKKGEGYPASDCNHSANIQYIFIEHPIFPKKNSKQPHQKFFLIRLLWSDETKKVLLNWKGQWYEINSKILLLPTHYSLLPTHHLRRILPRSQKYLNSDYPCCNHRYDDRNDGKNPYAQCSSVSVNL